MKKHPVLETEVRKLTAAIKAKDIQIPGKVDELKLHVEKSRLPFVREIFGRAQPTTKKDFL